MQEKQRFYRNCSTRDGDTYRASCTGRCGVEQGCGPRSCSLGLYAWDAAFPKQPHQVHIKLAVPEGMKPPGVKVYHELPKAALKSRLFLFFLLFSFFHFETGSYVATQAWLASNSLCTKDGLFIFLPPF